MIIKETPRFQKYKARKRDNWTAERLACKLYGVRVGWPALGLTFLIGIIVFAWSGWEMPGVWTNFDLAVWGILFIWLPLWIIALLDQGRSFGVFIGWLMFFLTSSKVRDEYRVLAERELEKTDEELFRTYVRSRPASSRWLQIRLQSPAEGLSRIGM